MLGLGPDLIGTYQDVLKKCPDLPGAQNTPLNSILFNVEMLLISTAATLAWFFYRFRGGGRSAKC